MAADGAFLVILLVVAYEAGGAVAAGVLGAVRVIPSIVSAPFAPSLVMRFRGDRVLAAINVVRATMNALSSAQSPDDIAAKRGKRVEEILG